MKKYIPWRTFFLIALLAMSVQSCLGIGGGSSSNSQNFKTVNTGSGQTLQVNGSDNALFKGKIYFTQNRTLLVIDGSRNVKVLSPPKYDIRNPAVSPDGKWIAFIVRYKYSSDLVYMPINGTHWTILRTGAGKYVPNPPYPAPISTHKWYAEPYWAADSTHLLFLSDFEKLTVNPGVDSQLLDLQVFSISKNDPAQAQEVAYAAYGDGGDSDPSYRPGPGHENQVVFTHFMYDSSQTQQVIQIYLIDANYIATHPNAGYHPGVGEYDPSVPLTPATTSVANMQPAFSPDGNNLAYVRRINATQMGIYVMPVANNITSDPGNAAVQKEALAGYAKSSLIVTGQFVSQPVWSPDGKQLAYLYYANNEFNIWLANLSVNAKTGAYSMKGSPVPLTSGGIDADSRPFWSN